MVMAGSDAGQHDDIVEPSYRTQRFRFGFVLSTALGNITRYQTLRKYASRDPQVTCVWAPVSHYRLPGVAPPSRLLPSFLDRRAIVFEQAEPVLSQLASFDAVLIHMYEVELWLALRSLYSAAPLRIASADDAPALFEDYPAHPVDRAKSRWRRQVRKHVDIWRAKRADHLIPFSQWAARIHRAAGVPQECITPIHTGLDLEIWTEPPSKDSHDGRAMKMLFVGGDFERKGGFELLAACRNLRGDFELDIVSPAAPAGLPAWARVHRDLGPGDGRLVRLFQQADLLVLPTRSDLSPWVVLEGMASGCAAVVSNVGGVPEFVDAGTTGLVIKGGSVEELSAALQFLRGNAAVARSMGAEGRKRVLRHFNASINVPLILDSMKRLVTTRNASHSPIHKSFRR